MVLARIYSFVDGELENRRGRKLYPNTRVEIPDEGILL